MMLRVFELFCGIHLVEHLAQIIQLYLLNWDRADCLGIIGLWYPMLIKNELLHFSFAIITLERLYYFYFTIKQIKSVWWYRAYMLQWFHSLEHCLLMGQFLSGITPTGIGGMWFPRIELHFFYNLMVIVPAAIALHHQKTIGDSF